MTESTDPDHLTQDEFCRRFVTRMVDAAGFDRFDDGDLVLDYARETAPTYYEIGWQRALGPEECAEADISYWGD